jgi:putative hydrolase of the HAD superfamily
MSKPELEIFEFLIFQHGMDVSKTLFIDDTEENIVAAKKLGLRTYLLKSPERVRDIFIDGKLSEKINIG